MSDEHGSDFVDELMEFLLRNYYSMMIKRVKRFFPNKFDAEDIVTETIIVLLENKSAVAAHEAPIKWLQTTLTHRVKQNSRIAKRNSEMFVSLETLDESKLPSVPDTADDYCEYSDFPFETMLGIIASELSEKDAKTFNDVFVLKRDREQIADYSARNARRANKFRIFFPEMRSSPTNCWFYKKTCVFPSFFLTKSQYIEFYYEFFTKSAI